MSSLTASAFGADEIVVTAAKSGTPLLELTGNTAKLSAERIRITNPQHINELGNQIAGVWLTRGNGQETLPAIRSPVLTGPGSCGAFLILEDGLPTRPTGFCNVNELFELPTEISQSVETIRGPSNALYGSNGLHGTMNILLPEPGSAPGWQVSGSAGPDDFLRGTVGWSGDAGRQLISFGLLADHYDGFQNDSGYDQQKGFVRIDQLLSDSTLGWTISAQNLDQDTAGFIEGKDAYKDPDARTINPFPEAYREANSERISVRWLPDPGHTWSGADARFYLRRSDMEFLMHFLPGQPREENGQISGGTMLTWRFPWRGNTLTTGLDLEVMDAFIEQFQANPTTEPPFLIGKLPQGAQYDFNVSSVMAAPYAQIEIPLGNRWQIQAGLRFEYLRYDYDNQLEDGNNSDGGTPCPDGCRYNRPADRNDDFFNVAPNLGLLLSLNEQTTAYATLTRGFRAPQATELYRLQEDQDIADLDTTTLDSLEVGLHRQTNSTLVELALFAMRKRNWIFQDVDRNNVDNGKTKHYGIELQGEWRSTAGFYTGAAGTWAKQTYDFTTAARGEMIVSGNDIDTAPRTLGSLRIGWEQGPGQIELEAVHQGEYYLDAANEHEYSGHNLLNLRALWRVNEQWQLTGRINNLADKLYADRADFAFGDYRYFPGREREFFIEISWRQ